MKSRVRHNNLTKYLLQRQHEIVIEMVESVYEGGSSTVCYAADIGKLELIDELLQRYLIGNNDPRSTHS